MKVIYLKRKEFCEQTRDRLAEKYRCQISYKNVYRILDCMRDTAIYALKRDKELTLMDILTLFVKDPYIRHGYNSFRKEPQDMHIGRKVHTKIAQGFLDDVLAEFGDE